MYGPKWPCLLMYMSHEIDVGTGCSLSRALRTKETLPDFHEWCRVTRHPQLFRRLTGCQRTPGFWGVTAWYQSQGKRLPWELSGCRA